MSAKNVGLFFLLSVYYIDGMEHSNTKNQKALEDNKFIDDIIITEKTSFKIDMNKLSSSSENKEKLASIDEIRGFVERARSTALSSRRRNARSSPVAMPLSSSGEAVFSDNALTQREIEEMSKRCHVEPEAFARFMYIYHTNHPKDPHTDLIKKFEKLKSENPEMYEQMQKYLLEKEHIKQVAKESISSSRGSSEGKQDVQNSRHNIIPTSEAFLQILQKQSNTDPLTQMFTIMLIEQHEQQEKAAKEQTQAARRNLWIAVVSGAFAFIQSVAWPTVITFLETFVGSGNTTA